MIKKVLSKIKEIAIVIKDKIIEHKNVIKKILIGVVVGAAIVIAVPHITHACVSDTVSATQNIGKNIKETVMPESGILEKGKEFFDDKIDSVINGIDEKTNEVLDKKLNRFEQKIFNFASKGIGTIFTLICSTVIKLPVALIYNPGIIGLYMKFVAIGCVLMPIILLFQYLKMLLNDEGVEPFPLVLLDIFKSVIFMFGFALVLPKLIILLNLATEAILAMGYSQLDYNMYLSMLGTDGISIIGLFLSMGLVITVLIFLLIIFFTTSIRYWDLCQLFITAPIAHSMNVSSKTRFYYYIWQNNMKETLLAQIMYGVHLLIFTAVLSNPLPGITDASLIKMMLLIGGIFRMMKIPGGLRDILSRGHEENKVAGIAKGAFSAFTKVPTGGDK